MTENHNYAVPEKGQTDWDVPINDNFESIDTDIEIRDAEGNRQNYTPKKGAKYLSTDTKKVYLGDGTQWNYLTTLGGTQGRIFVQDTEPDGEEGDIWIDTSQS